MHVAVLFSRALQCTQLHVPRVPRHAAAAQLPLLDAGR
jgi:hypothetical protein